VLLAFRVGNYRSLRDEVELSLMVPSWAADDDRTVRAVPPGETDRVGTVAAIYGPNASGKSNVLAAFRAMAAAVEHSHQRWNPTGGAPHDPFLLDEEHKGMPSLFETDLLLDGERWQYGFRLDQTGVAAEWLYSFPRNRKRVWFERERPDRFYFGKSLHGPTSTLQELTRPNSLFLSVGAANNHPHLTHVAGWFRNHHRYVDRNGQDALIRLTANSLDDEIGDRIQRLLSLADLGIVRAERKRVEMTTKMRSRLTEAMKVLIAESPVDVEAFIEEAEIQVEFHHRAGAGSVPLAFAQESMGTRTWFALLGPVVTALAHGDTLLVDELDSSLHPELSARLVQLYRDPAVNETAAQLIFTTHDTSLLGGLVSNTPLRRDELWLTEKDGDGATRLYPLTDFRPRKQENLERGYLQGRYGGTPVLPDQISLRRAQA
jgi:AAA15 family ATPase/GTPase